MSIIKPLVKIRQIMRLECKTWMSATESPDSMYMPYRDAKKFVQTTLAVCKVVKSDNYSLIRFTNQDKLGTKYSLNKDTVKTLLTRCLSFGKATIVFVKPAINIFIQADHQPLTRFCRLISNILKGDLEPGDSVSNMSVTGLKQSVKKLVIQHRSQWPMKGFPRSLEHLHLHGMSSNTLSKSILQLSKLRLLDLSDNQLEFIPKELNQLASLTELNLSNNYLFRSRARQWEWMGGCLSKSLILLDLSKNQLQYLPKQMVRLYNLVTLKVHRNDLESLPDNLGNLHNLMYLNISYNHIKRLPGSIRQSHLLSLDSHNNTFDVSRIPPAHALPIMPVLSLLESAARKVLRSKQRYSSEIIPFNLVDYLDNAKYCPCGSACFEVFILGRDRLKLSDISKEAIGELYSNIDVPYCSTKCFRTSYQYRIRNRNPVI